MKFYKVLTLDLVHNGYQFKEDGLNIDTVPFNSGYNVPGGICYSKEGIFQEVGKGFWIAEVIVPDDAITVEQKYGGNQHDLGLDPFWKSDRILLGKKEPINSVEVINRLISEGAHTNWGDGINAVYYLIIGGHYEAVDYLMSTGKYHIRHPLKGFWEERIEVPYPKRGDGFRRGRFCL